MSLPQPKMKHFPELGPRMAYEFACSSCRIGHFVPLPKHRKAPDDDKLNTRTVERSLSDAGWKWKNGFRHCLCSACQSQGIKLTEQPETPEVPAGPPAPSATEGEDEEMRLLALQRDPHREERRAIMDALRATYDDGTGCYRGNGSDASVARDLKMPVEWVRAIRHDFFGEGDGNEVSQENLLLIAKLEIDVKDVAAQYARVQASSADLAAAVQAIGKRLNEIGAELTGVMEVCTRK